MFKFIISIVIAVAFSGIIFACEQPRCELSKSAKTGKSTVKDKPVITQTETKIKLPDFDRKKKNGKTGNKPKLMLVEDLKKIEQKKTVMIDMDTPVPKGRFPLLPVWSSLTPRNLGCSAKLKQKVLWLSEIEHKSTKFTKIKTDKCTGYIKSKFIFELP